MMVLVHLAVDRPDGPDDRLRLVGEDGAVEVVARSQRKPGIDLMEFLGATKRVTIFKSRAYSSPDSSSQECGIENTALDKGIWLG